MSLDVTSSILKTKLKNTILKKGFQGTVPQVEQIAWFRWLNLDGSRTIQTPEDLFRFVSDHHFSLILPSDTAILPDLVSAVKGEIVFIAEYPRLAKQYEGLFESFTRDYIYTGKLVEYPLIQSTSVLITPDDFQLLYQFKAATGPADEHESMILEFIRKEGTASKKAIREMTRSVPYLFQRIDLYLYNLQLGMQICKTGFSAIEGNLYRWLPDALGPMPAINTTSGGLSLILEGLIRANLYVSPVKLQRALKKLADKPDIDRVLKSLLSEGKVYKTKVSDEPVLVHRQTMELLRKQIG